MVHLFEPYKFKHNKRATVLGELFEQLLETGYKQSEGQFFTPIPIARFLVNSLPLTNMVREKIDARATDFLPKVVDYASGAGHFLTETLDIIQEIVNGLDANEIGTATDLGRQIVAYQDQPMSWAGLYLHGIEKDYRLARTSKVACFMHGDGDANIIYGDGLEKHLSLPSNGTFDAVVANPPYAIDAFKPNLKVAPNDFSLLPLITDTSGNIEVLFIERAAQMLRPGGVAALILPSSILSNTGLYTHTRKLLIESFEIKAMVEFSSETFLATGTNTVGLFLRRRTEESVYNAGQVASDLIIDGLSRDPTLDSLDGEKHLAAYQYFLDVLPANYQALLRGDLTATGLSGTDIGRDYSQWIEEQPVIKKLVARSSYGRAEPEEQIELYRQLAEELIRQREYERFRLYLLVHGQQVLLVRGAKGKANQRKFLGYQFKKANRAHRLVAMKADANGNPITPLYDSTFPLNPERVNSHIQAALRGQSYEEVPIYLAPYLKVAPLIQCVDINRVNFEFALRLSPRPIGRYLGEGIASTWPYLPLGGTNGLCDINIGGTPSRDNPAFFEGPHPWVSVSELTGGRITETNETLTDEGLRVSNVKKLPAETVMVSFKLSIGKTAIAGMPLYTNEAIAGLIVKSKYRGELLSLYLYYLLNTKAVDLSATKDTDNSFGKSLNIKNLQTAQFPVPPIRVQEAIISAMQKLEDEDNELAKKQDELATQAGILLMRNARSVQVVNFATLCRDTIGGDESLLVDFVGLEHVEKNTGQLVTSWEPSYVRSTNSLFLPGDVLYGKLRPNLNKVWLADRSGQCSTEMVVLRSTYPHLLSFALRQKEVVNEAVGYVTNSYPRIKPDEVMRLTIQFPPDNELAEVEDALTALYVQQLQLRTQRAEFPALRRAVMEQQLVISVMDEKHVASTADALADSSASNDAEVVKVPLSGKVNAKKKATSKSKIAMPKTSPDEGIAALDSDV